MSNEQYDVSAKMKRLFDLKQKQRAAAKEYYLNLLYNPHRPGSDGMPFDPQLQRFSAMSTYHVDFFKPKGRDIFGYLLYLSPFFITYFVFKNYREKKEELIRSGQVKYSDREFKFIY